MTVNDFFDATRDLVNFVCYAPCCGKPSPQYAPRNCEGYAVVECPCGATWAVEVEPFLGIDYAGWNVYATPTGGI